MVMRRQTVYYVGIIVPRSWQTGCRHFPALLLNAKVAAASLGAREPWHSELGAATLLGGPLGGTSCSKPRHPLVLL
jgi:hypothetical protein